MDKVPDVKIEFDKDEYEKEKNLLPFDLDICEQCHRLGYETSAIDEENDLMWLCVGQIIKPEDPQDLHEKMNEIRLCVLRDAETDDVVVFDWTPYETSRVAMALIWALSNHLIKEQPTLNDLEVTKDNDKNKQTG